MGAKDSRPCRLKDLWNSEGTAARTSVGIRARRSVQAAEGGTQQTGSQIQAWAAFDDDSIIANAPPLSPVRINRNSQFDKQGLNGVSRGTECPEQSKPED